MGGEKAKPRRMTWQEIQAVMRGVLAPYRAAAAAANTETRASQDAGGHVPPAAWTKRGG